MQSKFHELQSVISNAIENRLVEFGRSLQHQKYAERYEKGEFRPSFALYVQEDELKCAWRPNRPRNCDEIIRLNFKQANEGLTPDEWESVSLKIKHHMESIGKYGD